MSPPPAHHLRRRTVLGALLSLVGAALAALAMYPVWRYLAPRKVLEAADAVTIPRALVPLGQAHFFNFRGRAAVVLQLRPGHYVALSAICTHLGCVVQWQPEQQRFLCPCHAGLFSPEGAVLGGPPPRPLEQLPVEIANDQLVVG